MIYDDAIKKENTYLADEAEVIVIGAGHAGIEAALAAAKLTGNCLLFTLSLDALANLPCNPSIGGTAKGQLVREIDALGGIMGKMADNAAIQYRMLNASKGPAVQSPRAQMDRRLYQQNMLYFLEQQNGLRLRQAEIVALLLADDKKTVRGVLSKTGGIYQSKKVIITTGTYLDAKVFIGSCQYVSGPDNIAPSIGLASDLKASGIALRRFKTGTPVRVNRSSIDFSQMEEQKADEKPFTFSFANEELNTYPILPSQSCYLCYTNEKTQEIIENNLSRSPLFSGQIEGVGPRYCPSIEDKIVRFKDKERHQIFVEPMGLNSQEMYLMGLSSSLPEDVQVAVCRSIKGLEKAVIQRSAYAIEYECLDPLQLDLDLSLREFSGLYAAGQINGTSGYEEAAAQGIIAGINAARSISKQEPLILKRNEAYIGVLIDDLVNKGTAEPYRMMTSRAEYRLILRHDNADYRLAKYGFAVGLLSSEEYAKTQEKWQKVASEIARLQEFYIKPKDELALKLYEQGLSQLNSKISAADLLARPQYTYQDLLDLGIGNKEISPIIRQACETEIKYKGYIELEEKRIERFLNMENKTLPKDIDYQAILGLSLEARQKLSQLSPANVGQASRISGISPADISVLLVYLQAKYPQTTKND